MQFSNSSMAARAGLGALMVYSERVEAMRFGNFGLGDPGSPHCGGVQERAFGKIGLLSLAWLGYRAPPWTGGAARMAHSPCVGLPSGCSGRLGRVEALACQSS